MADALSTIREVVAAFNEGRPADLMAMIADDAVFEIPGSSPVSGTYAGKQAIGSFFGKLATLAEGTQAVEPLHLLSGGADRAVIVWRVTARRKGVDFDGIAGFIFDVQDGRIVRALNLQEDQARVDAFWSS